jgi:signal transduction histidine kinase
VRDQGIGIAPEDQKRIFERFERAVSSRHFGGLGLGLWIVRQLVNAHGGTIRVESTPGEGARFEIDLPRHDAESTPKASAAGGPDAPPGVRSGAAAAAERAGRGEE